MKGSAGTAGAKRLAEVAKQLEKIPVGDDNGQLDTIAKSLMVEFESVRARIMSLKG
jgi:HPt (histidine-containing phosphotransfer) domain-containing protein